MDIRISGEVRSLKEKRKYLLSLKNSLKNKFNISIREISNNDKLNVFSLGIAYISLKTNEIDQLESKLIEIIAQKELDIIKIERQMI